MGKKDIKAGLEAIASKCSNGHTYAYWHEGSMWLLVGLAQSETMVQLQLSRNQEEAEITIPRSDHTALQLIVNTIQY